MRKITKREWENGMRYCTFCKQEGKVKPPAEYRNQHNTTIQLACEEHKHLLVDGEKLAAPHTIDFESDYYTEADYQTWLRL